MERNKYISKEFFLKIFILILLAQQIFMSIEFNQSLKDYEFTYCWNMLYGSTWTHEYYNNISIGKKNLTQIENINSYSYTKGIESICDYLIECNNGNLIKQTLLNCIIKNSSFTIWCK